MQLTKNFKLSEFRCKDGTDVPMNLIPEVKELAENLQVLRNHINKPITINSGYRTKEHNTKVNGKPKSLHLRAMAADIRVSDIKPQELKKIVLELINGGFMKAGGLKAYKTFLHYDTRGVLTLF
jgi:uncharacterized protein YcbK (DUF882 family)